MGNRISVKEKKIKFPPKRRMGMNFKCIKGLNVKGKNDKTYYKQHRIISPLL
jgi:hypothetical protein